MELLAYALFIIVLAIPFLVVGMIAAAFIAGITGIVTGIAGRRLPRILLGAVLLAGSGAAGTMIGRWATSPPTDAATSTHRTVYKASQELRVLYLAMRFLFSGGPKRLAEEQRARDAKR
jgi:hypothetical protein